MRPWPARSWPGRAARSATPSSLTQLRRWRPLAGVPGAGALDKALAEGYARAAAAVNSGAALGLLDRWVAASRELAQSDS